MHTFICRVASITFSLLLAVGTTRAGDVYVQTNLVTNNQSLVPALQTDMNLQGAWGLSFSTTSPFWISNQASGTATLYSVNDTQPPTAPPLCRWSWESRTRVPHPPPRTPTPMARRAR